VNVYYKGHVKRIRMDVCDLGKTEIISGMPWLAVHNPEINWETGEVKMTRCLPLCGGVRTKEEERKKRGRRVATLEEEKIRDSPKEILRVEESIWKGRVRENANEKSLGLCYRSQGDVQTMEGKDLSPIKE